MNIINTTESISAYLETIKVLQHVGTTSLLEGENLKRWEKCYNLAFEKLEKALEVSKGSPLIMDISELPKTEGMDIEQWLYYLSNLGVAFVNSKNNV